MSLLALERVTKRGRRGRVSRALLRDISLDVELGQFVSVWCVDGLERAMLARVAAGVERPDDGVVKLDGVELQHALAEERRGRLRFVEPYSAAAAGNTVLSYVQMPLLARGAAPRHAAERAAASLARVGVSALAELCVEDLDATEQARVAVAEALASEPQIIVLDDPTRQVDLLARGSIVRLLRSIADEGVAVLMTTSEAIGVAGVDRVLTLRDGKLRADVSAPVAEVVPLPARTLRS
ncbi:MAG TPA: ATP-binding cassette domain-containing protein [Conexibacter sp.]|nr:ATP-binding cassette domain-containing protein [Conexibacter sp.]